VKGGKRMYQPLEKCIKRSMEHGLSSEEVNERLHDAALETTGLRPGEEFQHKRDLFLKLVTELVEDRRITRNELCALAVRIEGTKRKKGTMLDKDLATAIRRLVYCPA